MPKSADDYMYCMDMLEEYNVEMYSTREKEDLIYMIDNANQREFKPYEYEIDNKVIKVDSPYTRDITIPDVKLFGCVVSKDNKILTGLSYQNIHVMGEEWGELLDYFSIKQNNARYQFTATTQSGSKQTRLINGELYRGKQVTISCDIKWVKRVEPAEYMSFLIYFYGDTSLNIAYNITKERVGEVIHISKTLNITDTVTAANIYPSVTAYSGNIYEISNVQVSLTPFEKLYVKPGIVVPSGKTVLNNNFNIENESIVINGLSSFYAKWVLRTHNKLYYTPNPAEYGIISNNYTNMSANDTVAVGIEVSYNQNNNTTNTTREFEQLSIYNSVLTREQLEQEATKPIQRGDNVKHIKIGVATIPDNAINKIYPRQIKRSTDYELIIEDMLGGHYVYSTGALCDVMDQKKALVELLEWEEADLPAQPATKSYDLNLDIGNEMQGTADTAEGYSDLQWSSDNEDICIVDARGKMTAVGAGRCTVTASYSSPMKATVTRYYVTVTMVDTTLTVSPTTVNITETQTANITVNTNASSFTMTSQNETIAFASADTKQITGLKAGTTNVIVKAKKAYATEKTQTIKVNVTEQPTTQLTVSPASLSMYVGEEKTISITTNAPDFLMASNNTSVAGIDKLNKKVSGVHEGTTSIVITAIATGSKQARFELPVTVMARPVTTLTVDPHAMTLKVGESGTIDITTNASSFNMTSSNTAIATVDKANKRVAAKAVGSCNVTIDATVANGNKKTETVAITVQPAQPSVSTEEITLVAGDLHTGVMPDVAGFSGVEWTASDERVCDVDASTGVISALAQGTCEVQGFKTSPYRALVKEYIVTVTPTA